jgi:sugar lactone lactonase YvrE
VAQNVELVVDAKATLGEGPIWDAQDGALLWVDIVNHLVHVTDTKTGADRTISVGQMVGAIVPRKSGGLMMALENGFASLDLKTGQVTPICDPESHLPNNRFNDGKCDPAGRFWAGTMSKHEDGPSGSLYRLDTNLQANHMFDGVTVSNGLAWSPDHRTMYYIDTPTKFVVAFDYDKASGAIANRREVVRIPDGEGMPDGMTIDADGNLWVAHWGGWCVSHWNPATGKLLGKLAVPAAQVTSCCFGGPELDTLYITSARIGISEDELSKQPLAGGLFRTRPGVRGTPTEAFAG